MARFGSSIGKAFKQTGSVFSGAGQFLDQNKEAIAIGAATGGLIGLTTGGASGAMPGYTAGAGTAAVMSAMADAPAAEVMDQTIAQGADQVEEEKKRRAAMLAGGRQGSIKTGVLGLPGGGVAYAQKTLLGA